MVKPEKPALSVRYRLGVTSRLLAAVVGGYVCTALATACLALGVFRGMSVPRAEAALGATLPAFLIFCAAVIWVFAARSAWRAWCGLMIPCLLFGVGYLWLSEAWRPWAALVGVTP